jgi:hypothetical protein
MIMQELCVERAKTDRYRVNTPVSLGNLWLSGYIFSIGVGRLEARADFGLDELGKNGDVAQSVRATAS